MIPEYAKPGDTVVECPHCGYEWPYSGNNVRATCPSCGYKCKVAENQKGMVLSCEDEVLIDIDEYDQTVRRALSLGLKRGNRDYRDGIAEAFTTKDGGSHEF
ncbi:hypothetical protein [Natrinema altunense]|uniref:hypothetical protein n=1 Tax=Natrinema altunense TaxID=222984 RepID=UPI0009DA45A9|nr:hypothetical protein [Natrinema altunense]